MRSKIAMSSWRKQMPALKNYARCLVSEVSERYQQVTRATWYSYLTSVPYKHAYSFTTFRMMRASSKDFCFDRLVPETIDT
jgi:hypothetical protein